MIGVILRAVMLDQWVLTYPVDSGSLYLYFNTFQVSKSKFGNDQATTSEIRHIEPTQARELLPPWDHQLISSVTATGA